MTPNEIRRAARIADVPLWRLAEEIGIGEATLFRWLRHPLSEERLGRTLAALDRLQKGANQT